MKTSNYLLLLFLGIILISCGDNSGEKSSDFSLNFPENRTEYRLGDTLNVTVKSASGAEIDSVIYKVGEQQLQIAAGGENLRHVLQNEKLGKWDLTAQVYSEGAAEEIRKQITLYNNTPPAVYTYRIVATYPHATDAYTQGLEFHGDTLYESTGHYGQSSLRKVDLRTGEVLESVSLDDSYFAEGMTILNDKIYQLTWREGEGFIYDVNSLERTGSFAYNQSEEGWGLANDGERFYKSDGTEKIWILNAETLSEENYIQTVTNSSISTQLNELEWVEGKLYANTYQKNGVAIINPENGAVEGVINFNGLKEELGNKDDLDSVNDVLNGVAYHKSTGKLYVTGKNWDTLFEVEIEKR